MPNRKLRIVKLTPVALGLCEHCNGQFHSLKPSENDAKAEIAAQFDVHQCQRQDANHAASPLGYRFMDRRRFGAVVLRTKENV
jgi:hypothetical protein